MGTMGLAPSQPGQHDTVTPRRTGGNIECKELQTGSTLFLPIEVEGGYFLPVTDMLPKEMEKLVVLPRNVQWIK